MAELQEKPVVVLFQYRVFHYRKELLSLLREKLEKAGIKLELVYGQAYGDEIVKADVAAINWGHQVRNFYLPVKEKKDLCWQPMPESISRPDLVIFMQENRLLSNYYWILQSKLGRTRTAFWGHGRDFQSKAPTGLRERWKKATIRSVDWWFAYTSITLDVLAESRFPPDRTTLLNNSIDTVSFQRDGEAVTDQTLSQLKEEWKIDDDAPVGLFCGSLYPDKKPTFMIAAADLIYEQRRDFHFIVIGDGQSAKEMCEAASTRPWMHCVGVKRGIEKAALFKLATFVINPGLVGLHVLDAYAFSLPMLTTSTALHSPEIAYLEHGKTGFITDGEPAAFADCALKLIGDPALAKRIRENCRLASLEYSIERMATRFTEGIVHCLQEVPKKTRFSRSTESSEAPL